MRITADEKQATRRRIVEAAFALFGSNGFEATTTRDIARAANIATGTLFNYFQTKEAIVALAAEEAVLKGRAAFARQNIEARLDEELFALVAAELRQLKPLRKFLSPVLETLLSPLAAARQAPEDDPLRRGHLEVVAGIVQKHGVVEISAAALQIYWALYTGVLAFWTTDKSPKQEETLALLDQSLNMFVAWLASRTAEPQ